jgi:hypothetical protein
MIRRDKDFHKNSQQSINYPLHKLSNFYNLVFGKSYLYGEYGALKSHIHIFWQDLRANLFPHFKNKDFLFVSASEDNINKIHSALGSENYYLSDTLWHFLDRNGVISNLLIYEKCYFEIVYNDHDDFFFESLDPSAIFQLTTEHIYQYLPKDIRIEKNLSRFQKLNSKNIFCIKLSGELKKDLKGVIKGIGDMSSNSDIPEFVRNDLMKGAFPNYDRSWYSEKGHIYRAKITKNTGWSGRETLSRNMSEYYQLHRKLKFDQFVIDFRKCIIDGMNKGFNQVSVEGWELIKLEIKNAINEEDVTKVRKSLESGDCSFREVFSFR